MVTWGRVVVTLSCQSLSSRASLLPVLGQGCVVPGDTRTSAPWGWGPRSCPMVGLSVGLIGRAGPWDQAPNACSNEVW
jgi:hypothetical protein